MFNQGELISIAVIKERPGLSRDRQTDMYIEKQIADRQTDRLTAYRQTDRPSYTNVCRTREFNLKNGHLSFRFLTK
jgi:hypothetical protein